MLTVYDLPAQTFVRRQHREAVKLLLPKVSQSPRCRVEAFLPMIDGSSIFH